MKPPITYHGGKQKMIKHILPIIPPHEEYAEVFAGGASLFFHKKKCNKEYINDINGNLAAFYRAMKFSFVDLNKRISSTLHCEHTYKIAKEIYCSNELISDLDRAWAVWVNSRLSFGGQMCSSFQYMGNKNDKGTKPTTTTNKRKEFTRYQYRLENTVIFNRDALEIIKRLDSKDMFFFIDPPYFGTSQGHYSGYKKEHFIELIKLLEGIKGKFILSSYPNEFIYKKGWTNNSFNKALGFGVSSAKRKTEVLTYNFQVHQPLNLFTA